MRKREAIGYIYGCPSSDRPAYVMSGAYIHEYPHGPAVFVALDDVWYDCAKPFEARFRFRDGRVYDIGTGLLRYRATAEPATQRAARPARRAGLSPARRPPHPVSPASAGGLSPRRKL